MPIREIRATSLSSPPYFRVRLSAQLLPLNNPLIDLSIKVIGRPWQRRISSHVRDLDDGSGPLGRMAEATGAASRP
jgi:hypothetical protein